MIPVRTCVGCRQRLTQSEMFRIVNRAGKLAADFDRKLSGRGAWLHKKRECLDQAIERRAFARAFRFTGQFDTTELEEQAEKMLAK
jgi:predicted RNA-binding protein YlxR (DUF448 family)